MCLRTGRYILRHIAGGDYEYLSLGARQNDRPGRQKGARAGQPPGRIDQLSGRAVLARTISTWRIWEALRRNWAPNARTPYFHGGPSLSLRRSRALSSGRPCLHLVWQPAGGRASGFLHAPLGFRPLGHIGWNCGVERAPGGAYPGPARRTAYLATVACFGNAHPSLHTTSPGDTQAPKRRPASTCGRS
jgi:hypothetical protein